MLAAKPWTRWFRALAIIPLLLGCFAWAQDSKTFKQEELDQILAPIALYPDSLLSQVLMAATYPADVAEASKWSQSNPDQKGDQAVKAVADQPWDPSVQSLVAFPQVLVMMGDKPDWVRDLGDAFLAQPEDVMDTVQGLRKRAQDQGNLESTEQQKVIVEPAPQTQETIIKIEPASPQVVYVPTYNPTVVYGSWWWPSYPPPFYWRPPPGYGFVSGVISGIGFGIGISITNSLWGGFNWGRHDVDINVNRYNNININRPININQNKVSWKHNPDNRRGVPYRDARSRQQFGKQVAGAETRKDFRGRDPAQRDASRQKAQQALAQRGMDPKQQREKLRSDPKTRERAQAAAKNVDRDKARAAAQSVDRDKARAAAQSVDRDKARAAAQGVDRDKARAAAQKVDRDKARAAAQGVDRDRARQTAQRRAKDHAFKGAGSAKQTRQQANRGAASRQMAGGGAGGFGGGARRAR